MILEREITFCNLNNICEMNKYCNGRFREIDKKIVDGEIQKFEVGCDYWKRLCGDKN